MQVTIAQATSKAQNTLTRISFFLPTAYKAYKKIQHFDFVKIDFLVIFNDFQEQN